MLLRSAASPGIASPTIAFGKRPDQSGRASPIQRLKGVASHRRHTNLIISSLTHPLESHSSLKSQPTMANSIPPVKAEQASVVSQERVLVTNKHGEKLAGVLHDTGSKKLVILCHGFRCTKESNIICSLTAALTTKGIGVFCFDFAGNGESEGTFQYGHYRREVGDLLSVVQYLSERNYEISAILGHSKGGDVVLLYASMYHDVPKVINVSGRYALEKGIKERLGEKFMERIKNDGFIDVRDKTGKVQYRVTEESLMDRLNTDMRAACLSIDKNYRVLTVHGSSDEIIPVEDAFMFDQVILNHKLHIIEGADHSYTSHQTELASVVVEFINSDQVEGSAPGDILMTY